MTLKEKFSTFKGGRFTTSWAYSPSIHRPRAVLQSAIIAATKVGMEVTLAHPPEMALDPEVLAACEKQAHESGGSFRVTNDCEEALTDTHVVYPKAWAATPIFQPPIGESNPRNPDHL